MSTPASRTKTLSLLWLVVTAEIVSPIPLALSIGTVYVLLFRPRWFLNLVHDLYAERF